MLETEFDGEKSEHTMLQVRLSWHWLSIELSVMKYIPPLYDVLFKK